MNPLYLDPNDCPWTDEYRENTAMGRCLDLGEHSRYWCDENEDEYKDALYGVV